MIKVASLPLDMDLLAFSSVLQRQGIPHHIAEESGCQVIRVHSSQEAAWVRQLLEVWLQQAHDQGNAEPAPHPPADRQWPRRLWRAFRISPVTLSLIAVSLLVAAVSALGARADRVALLFYPPLGATGPLELLAELGDPLLIMRTLTPMFLHFGELHLVFNMLWLWYFGRQLETVQPTWLIAGLIAIIAFLSNTTQYLATGSGNFGGMSGVVYGLVGYTWIIHTFMPRSHLMLNNAMFGFFVVALILMELLASSWIATAAHVGGLMTGLSAGVATVLYYRLVLKRPAVSRG